MYSSERRQGIMLNGRWYSRQSLSVPGMSSQQEDPLVRKVLQFMHQWLDEQEVITLFTSGSTGPPKKVNLPKKALLASAEMTGRFFGLKPGMTAHLCLSPDYVAGKMMIVRALAHGMDLLTTHLGANPLDTLTRAVDFSSMVPLQVANVLKYNPQKMKLVKTLIIGGGAVSPLIEQELMHLKTSCWHTYGMTETLSHIALRPMNGPERTEWFTPLPGVELSTDPRGCLVISVPAIIPDRLVTNDLVLLKDNLFQVLGRWDDVINSAGHKLHPSVIEKKIGAWLSLPFFLTSEHHPSAGQILVLFVQAPPAENHKQQIQEGLVRELQPHEVPRKIIMLPRFAVLESGKINRQATKELYYSSR